MVIQFGRVKSNLAIVTIPEWNGAPKDAGEVWTLTKGQRIARCSLFTHPKGAEVRLTVDGEWHRGEALSDGLALVDLALEWRQQFEQRGWK
jgi:hypothetical protein